MNNVKLAIVSCAAVLAASPAVAQGGGGFGLTLPQNVGPRYPGDEQKDVGGCIWRRQWVIDPPRVALGSGLLLERAVSGAGSRWRLRIFHFDPGLTVRVYPARP